MLNPERNYAAEPGRISFSSLMQGIQIQEIRDAEDYYQFINDRGEGLVKTVFEWERDTGHQFKFDDMREALTPVELTLEGWKPKTQEQTKEQTQER